MRADVHLRDTPHEDGLRMPAEAAQCAQQTRLKPSAIARCLLGLAFTPQWERERAMLEAERVRADETETATRRALDEAVTLLNAWQGDESREAERQAQKRLGMGKE